MNSIPDEVWHGMVSHMPRLPAIRTTTPKQHSPGPLGATPQLGPGGFQTPMLPTPTLTRAESHGSLPDYRGFSPVAYRPQTPRTYFGDDNFRDPRNQPAMNPVAMSHRVARNRHFEKSMRGGVGGWFHKMMAEREDKKFKKTYV